MSRLHRSEAMEWSDDDALPPGSRRELGAAQRRAAHHTCPGGHMKHDQCSRCDAAAEALDIGLTRLLTRCGQCGAWAEQGRRCTVCRAKVTVGYRWAA